MKENKTSGRLLAIMFILTMVLFAYLLGSDMIAGLQTQREYCISHGWDDVDTVGKCYRDVPHESGTGTVRIYSGEIKWEDIIK